VSPVDLSRSVLVVEEATPSKMSSPTIVKDEYEKASLLLNEGEDEEKEIVTEPFFEFVNCPTEEQNIDQVQNETSMVKATSKRKRKPEESTSVNLLTDMFLRLTYPISRCMTKHISIGMFKPLDYSPAVILNQGTRVLLFTENAWESFTKHMHLIECYLTNNLFGRKSAIRLLDCDIEIDIVKYRGEQQVRLRDLSKYNEKVQLNREDFYNLSCVSSPITRYLRQLVFSSSVVKDYLVDTMEKQPDLPILYGPVDTSIFNRIPHEVEMWRRVTAYKVNEETKEEENVNITIPATEIKNEIILTEGIEV